MDIAALRRWALILGQLVTAQMEVERRKQYAVGRGTQ